MNTAYQSIFLNANWAHQKYYGWTVLTEAFGFKVLSKTHGPLRRCLVLSDGLSGEELEAHISAAKILDARTGLLLHDFSDPGEERRSLCRRTWRRAETGERMLNIATFVINLAGDDATLFQAMSSDYRRKIKKAADSGIFVTIEARPDAPTIAAFLARFQAMADERGLTAPDAQALSRMFAAGDLTLYTAMQAGEILNAVTVYRADDKAIFLYGVGGDKRNDGSGALLHWEIMRHLRGRSVRWYDLGGLPAIEPNSGIYRFKKGFGGELVQLGSEYILLPFIVKAAQRIKTRISR